MAPLKFRAWHIYEKKMLPVEMLVSYTEDDRQKCRCDGEVFAVASKVSHFYPSECIVMQATGLKDQKGVEIFEGDVILKFCKWPVYSRVGSVEWGRPDRESGMWEIRTFRFESKANKKYDHFLEKPYFEPFGLGCEPQNYEVIGNIYSDPHLLS